MAKFEETKINFSTNDDSSLNNYESENEYSSSNESQPKYYSAMTFEEKFDLAQSLNKGFHGAQHKRLNVAFKSFLMREIDQKATLKIINEEIGELVHLKISDVSKVSQISSSFFLVFSRKIKNVSQLWTILRNKFSFFIVKIRKIAEYGAEEKTFL